MFKSRSSTAIIWSFTDNILQQGVNFVVGIILARLLLPEEFGLLGIVSVFIALSNTFVNMGLNDALINKQNATETDNNTLFYANIGIGVVVYVCFFFLARFIAAFFEQDSLVFLIRFAGISIIFISFSSIQRTLLTKELNFKTISIVSFIAVFISGIVAIVMAYNGFGVTSLVTRMVLGQFLTTLLFWILHKWRPEFIFNFKIFKELWKYGINIFFVRIMDSLFNDMYYIVIGKIFSPAALGYYTRADNFKNILSINIYNTLQRVSFSSLSAQRDKDSFPHSFFKFFVCLSVLLMGSMAFLFTFSEEIIITLVGEKWLISSSYLKIISIAGFFTPLWMFNLTSLTINRKTKKYFRVNLIFKLLSVIPVIAGILWGLKVMLMSASGIALFLYLLSLYTTHQEVSSIKKEWVFLGKGLIAMTICYLVITFIKEYSSLGFYWGFLVNVAVFIVISILLLRLWVAPGIWQIIKNTLKK